MQTQKEKKVNLYIRMLLYNANLIAIVHVFTKKKKKQSFSSLGFFQTHDWIDCPPFQSFETIKK